VAKIFSLSQYSPLGYVFILCPLKKKSWMEGSSMSAESGTDKAVRREKIVMALGIAAIILFSANLLTMVARHFWPDFRFESLFAAGNRQAVTEVETLHEVTDDHAVHVFVKRHRHRDGEQRFVIRMDGETLHLDAREAFREKAADVEADLRAEMERLGRDIARQKHRLEADMNARQEVRLRSLRLDRINERQIERSLGRLEAELESELAAVKNTLRSTASMSADSGN